MSEQKLYEIIEESTSDYMFSAEIRKLAETIIAAGYREINPLTDEELDFIHRRLQGMTYYEEHIRGKLGL